MNRICKLVIMASVPFIFFINAAHTAGPLNAINLPVEREAKLRAIQAKDTKNALTSGDQISFGEKFVIRDPSTDSPRRVIGASERIIGYEKITEGNVDEAARAFLKSKEKDLGLAGIELKLRRATHVNGRWYVTYGQIYKGLDVLLTEVELRIFDSGNVAMYGADVIADLNLETKPKLSAGSADMKLQKEIGDRGRIDALQSDDKLYALPIRTGSGVVCRLVRRRELITGEGSRFINYSDANEGSTLWRFEKTSNLANKIAATGSVREKTAIDPPKEFPFTNMSVMVGDEEYFTDENGEIALETAQELPVLASLSGKWAKVTVKNKGKNASYNDTIRVGTPLNIKWTDNNSHAFERSVYRSVNLIHSDLKSIDTSFKIMDFPMPVTLDFSGSYPNAYSAGKEIVFLAAKNDQVNMPETPSILFHEYTHSINGLLYESLGVTDGMVNASANEGQADLYACIMQKQPKVGYGAFKEDTNKYIRCSENNMIFPDSLGSDSHYNGQILSGAYWDLIKLTSFDFVKKLSHFAKYSLADDPNIGTAYSEWFLETLIADDDDGDLSNGTPHSNEIIAAFNKHQIGTDLLLAQTFSHAPIADTQDTLNPIPVEFTLNGPKLAGAGISDMKVIYSNDGWTTSSSLSPETLEEGKYRTYIPAQKAGSFVSYYIVVTDNVSGRKINLINDRYSKSSIDFTVGFKRAYINKCENSDGWTIGDEVEDIGANGVWVCDAPGEVDLTEISNGLFGLLQIGHDHSADGENCFVTGAEGTNPNNPGMFPTYMVMGRTTLYSPEIPIKGLDRPILKFWYFTTLELLNYLEVYPFFEVFAAIDGIDSWTSIAKITESTTDWELKLVDISKLFPNAEKIRFKIAAENMRDYVNNKLNLCEVELDDIEILSLNGTLSANVENPSANLSIYPNPATETITAIAPFSGNLTITDPLGMERIQTNVVEGTNRININSLPAGVYFAKIATTTGTSVAKFIKK